ncbi:MAG: nucleoside deaminase [Chlamydiae bacterium]|nr:nucleoside deaminase [Chlamydiota bacterium]MBI3266811.1 nucleoside deaminase [Chlamydiota bacterium]
MPLKKDADKDVYFMSEALKEADAAFEEDETPVGACIIHEGKIIAKAHNQVELLKDPTAHAEMIAITQAAAHLKNWRLEGCTLYVTKEPCLMCSGAIFMSRVPRLVFGAMDEAAKGLRDLIHPGYESSLREMEIMGGVLADPCQKILKEFFKKVRGKSGN